MDHSSTGIYAGGIQIAEHPVIPKILNSLLIHRATNNQGISHSILYSQHT